MIETIRFLVIDLEFKMSIYFNNSFVLIIEIIENDVMGIDEWEIFDIKRI